MQIRTLTLLDIFTETRNLTFYFLNKLSDGQKEAEPLVNGITLNSAHWNMAHIAWAEYFLIHQAFGINEIKSDWFDLVKIGSPKCKATDLPALTEVLETLAHVHQHTILFLKEVQDNQLEEDNLIDLTISGNKSKGMMLIHAIRHEGIHAGQIDWLAKITA